MNAPVKIIECPRDAMQGWTHFIPTDVKANYINTLLRVGFDTIDFGSFVSAKAIPQMADTAKVLAQLDLSGTQTKLLAIVANTRGAQDASQYAAVTYLGFPLSISETFQRRNTNKSIAEALNTVEEIGEICAKSGKELVTYISMGFGNPYGDPYEADLVGQFVDILVTLGVNIISLADTIGVAEAPGIESLVSSISNRFRGAEIGVHLHSTPATARAKIEAAYRGGCRRFDGAIKGFGGCPMAKDELVGNIATETILNFMEDQDAAVSIDKDRFLKALGLVDSVFHSA